MVDIQCLLEKEHWRLLSDASCKEHGDICRARRGWSDLAPVALRFCVAVSCDSDTKSHDADTKSSDNVRYQKTLQKQKVYMTCLSYLEKQNVLDQV